jgi:peroxidase
LDANYQDVLKQECKPNDITSLVNLDANNATAFDLGYYSGLSQKKGLLTSDVALLDNPTTNSYILSHTNGTSVNEFFADFSASFILMGKIGALTHHKGEIRMQCSAVNPPAAPSPAPSPSSSNSVEMRSSFSSLLSVGVVLTYLFFQYY